MKNRIRALRDFLEEIASSQIDFSHTPCPHFDPEELFSEDYRYFMQIIGKCEIGSSPIPGYGYQILNVDHPVAMNKPPVWPKPEFGPVSLWSLGSGGAERG